jgi:hypothetical protein
MGFAWYRGATTHNGFTEFGLLPQLLAAQGLTFSRIVRAPCATVGWTCSPPCPVFRVAPQRLVRLTHAITHFCGLTATFTTVSAIQEPVILE